jgi:ubiquinone/menaquinone biosynthesis C-methylase UbiE
MFKDEFFDTVLCSAVLEHDKFFWKTISEIKRVTKPGGVIVIGVPGFADLSIERFLRNIPLIGKYQRKYRKMPGEYQKISFIGKYLGSLYQSTVTFKLHNYPGDYYRFSPQTVQEVFFEGMKDVDVRVIMVPPRIIASGIKP